MRLTFFEIDEDGREQLADAERQHAKWLMAGPPRRVDIEGATRDELHQFLSPLGVPEELIIRAATRARGATGPLLGDWHYFQIGLPNRQIGSEADLSILMGETVLITIHEPLPSRLESLARASVGRSSLPEPSVRGMLYHFLLLLGEVGIDDYLELRDRLDTLARGVDESPDALDVEAIVPMKHRISALLSDCEDQLYVCGWLWDLEVIQGGQLERNYSLAAAQLERFRAVLVRCERRLQDLHQQYLMTLQETTNSRLRILTILSAVFMPMTLVAGVYGMNFRHMPELDEPWAYFVVLGAMAFMGLGMMTFFYLKGWFE